MVQKLWLRRAGLKRDTMIKKRVIGVAFAVAVGGCGLYGAYKWATLPETMTSEGYFKPFVEQCSQEKTIDIHGCVLSKMFKALPLEIAHGAVFIVGAAGLGRYRRRILKL